MNKILINALLLNEKLSGVQYYIKNLLSEFESIKSSDLKCSTLLSSDYQKEINFNGVNIETPTIDTKNRINRLLYEHVMLSKLFSNRYDVLHAPGYILPYFWKKASVLTVHDLIALDYPQLCQNETVLYFKTLLPYSIKKASKVIAVSNTVKADILRRFDIEEEKISVIYHGINKQFKKIYPNNQKTEGVRIKYNLPNKYILFVGNIEPKKNLLNLINAFNKLKREKRIEHKLVIVGKKGWKYKPIFENISKLKIDNELIFTGYIPEEDLPTVYSMADLFVFPSLYEGFGIPPLEAMACEVPVMVSNSGSLPEITGGKCLQVDPFNIEEIASGIHKSLTDTGLRDKSILEGKKWVKQYSWEKSAKETLKVYEEAIHN